MNKWIKDNLQKLAIIVLILMVLYLVAIKLI